MLSNIKCDGIHVARIALYSNKEKPKEKPEDIYIYKDYHKELLILNRNNLADYIPDHIYNDKKYGTANKSIQKAVYTLIKNGYVPTSKSKLPYEVETYYMVAQKYINEAIPRQLIAEANHRFYVGPSLRKNQRDFIIMSGPSGSGKSYLASDFAANYQYTYEGKRKIYFISNKDQDDSIDSLKYVYRVPKDFWQHFMKIKEKAEKKRPIKKQKKTVEEEEGEGEWLIDPETETQSNNNNNNTEITDKPPVIDKFKESLFIFDDIENIQPEERRKMVYDFKAFITQEGRAKQIDIVLCNHMSMRSQQSREELNEATAICVFPMRGNRYNIEKYLETYEKLNKEVIKRINDQTKNWAMIYRTHPRTVVNESEVFIIKE
jgi:hypothetical protein